MWTSCNETYLLLYGSLQSMFPCDHVVGNFCLWLFHAEQIISIKLWLASASFISGLWRFGGNDLLNMCFTLTESLRWRCFLWFLYVEHREDHHHAKTIKKKSPSTIVITILSENVWIELILAHKVKCFLNVKNTGLQRRRWSFLNVLLKCKHKRENRKHCFDKWIHQPQTGENSIYMTRWVLKRFITSYFPQNLTSAAQASQHSLNQTKCGS